MVAFMIVHIEFDPTEASYQFLYQIALYDTNPENLDEIYNVINTCALRESDCFDWNYTFYDESCSALGVKNALVLNENTSAKTMIKLASDMDEMLRATISARTSYDEVINVLIDDTHIYVVKNLLENRNLKKAQFDKIVQNFLNGKYDFTADYNKNRMISEKQFSRLLSNHRFAQTSPQ